MTIDKQFHGDLEAISKGEMLAAQTEVKGSAGYVAIERVTGSLRPGKRADIVILDTDDERDLAYRVGARLIREVYAAGRRVRA